MCLNVSKSDAYEQDVCCYVAMFYLVGVVHEMNWDAEWQWMVVRIPQQDGDDLHSWRSGLPLSIL